MQKPICDMVHPTHENAMPKSNVRLVRKPVEKLKSQKGIETYAHARKNTSGFKPHGSTESTETLLMR